MAATGCFWGRALPDKAAPVLVRPDLECCVLGACAGDGAAARRFVAERNASRVSGLVAGDDLPLRQKLLRTGGKVPMVTLCPVELAPLATECVASGAGRAFDLFLRFPVGLAPLATECVASGAGLTFGGAGLTFDLVLGLVLLRCTAVVGAVSGRSGSVWG